MRKYSRFEEEIVVLINIGKINIPVVTLTNIVLLKQLLSCCYFEHLQFITFSSFSCYFDHKVIACYNSISVLSLNWWFF